MKGPDPVWKRPDKKVRCGVRGYLVGTIAFYGPANEYASKVAVGVIFQCGAEPTVMKKWFANDIDVRQDPAIAVEIRDFLRSHGALTVVMTRGIIGCPHEEGIDYPMGTPCPQCRFWADRDRWKDV